MNITILTNRDIASAYALEQLMAGLKEHKIEVFMSARIGSKNSHTPSTLQDLSAFDQGLVDNWEIQGLRSSCSFEAIEAQLQEPITLLSSVKTEESLAALSKTEADLIISIRFGLILHQEAIATAKLGVINLHSGILPNYKGVMATFWAMKNREKNIGTTLHYIQDSKIDSGDILRISQREVDYQRSYLWNALQLYPQGCRDIISAVNELSANEKLYHQAQETGGHYYSFPSERDIKTFQEQGNTLFDNDDVLSLLQENA